jgi:predicted enzyme related to lactoylglutathione lyase
MRHSGDAHDSDTWRRRRTTRKGVLVAHPVVHFEIIGKDPQKLRNYFGELFGWQFDTSAPVAEAVSEPENYGFVDRVTTPDGTGVPGGIGGGQGYGPQVVFYVGVPDVGAALAEAERLGGKRRMGPERAPTGLVVGHFTDPEGNLIGVAGPA